MPDLLPEPAYFATLARAIASASVILRDEHGRVVIEDPNYRDHWLLPGGSVDPGEDPRQCAQREVAEELGVEVQVGRLLTVNWVPGRPSSGAPMGLHFVFDAGVLPAAQLEAQVVAQVEELDGWMLATEEQLSLLGPWGERRARRSLAVLRGDAPADLFGMEH